MKWTVLSSCLLLLLLLLLLLVSTLTTAQAEPGSVTPRPQENKSRYPDPAALFSGARAAEREGALLLLRDYTKQGDTLLKERLKDSYSNLKDMLKQGDSVLKEQLAEGVAQLKEQRKEGDERLKEKLNEDVAWLKDRLAEGQTRMKEELAEEEAKVKEELAEQRDSVETLKTSVKQSIHMKNDDLKQQMSDFKEELKNTKLQLQTELRANQETLQSTQETLQSTQETLQSTQETLQSTQETLQSTQTDLQSTQETVRKTEEDLLQTREQLQKEMQMSAELKSLLQAAEEEIVSLKVHSQQCGHRLDLLESSDMGQGQDSGNSGSAFIRWGSTTCPDNTSLVYSGVAGGSLFNTTGGGSNYLCLVNDPQLDNMTLPNHFNKLSGTEYEGIVGRHNQDVVCSVCRAPQPTTIMIPATLTCPSGWTPQYRGHLVAGHQNHKGKSEYVCVDEAKEHRDGGYENKNGALMYLVVPSCGSLPCPPYDQSKVVTCVVCSM